MDYYDYNVVNAGAAPGSYLGMDPAYLVWIPPLDDGNEFDDDIRPKQFVDPGSNQESPEEEIVLPKIRRKSISEITTVEQSLLEKSDSQELPQVEKRRKSTETIKDTNPKTVMVTKIEVYPQKNTNSRSDESKGKLQKQKLEKNPKDSSSNLGGSKGNLNISLRKEETSPEKETEVEKVKSPSFDNLDDIKFADDCDEEIDNIMCNNKISYHENKNIIVQSKIERS